jgi:hypothetical protein
VVEESSPDGMTGYLYPPYPVFELLLFQVAMITKLMQRISGGIDNPLGNLSNEYAIQLSAG